MTITTSFRILTPLARSLASQGSRSLTRPAVLANHTSYKCPVVPPCYTFTIVRCAGSDTKASASNIDIGDKSPTLAPTSSAQAPSSSEFVPVFVAEQETTAVITGSILPFSQLNFIQTLFLPYTYAVMYYMDFLLNYVPWWLAIVGTTATARLAFFPLVVKQNIVGIRAFNILPQTQKLQVEMNEALTTGDAYGQAVAKTKLKLLYEEHKVTMKDRLKPVLIQAPLYASIFFLLRTVTGVPVESMINGGALWFTNLCEPDPYYILPLMTSTSMFILIEYGLEGGSNPSTSMGPLGRWMMRGLPVGLFFFIQQFPAATLLFWTTSNLFTVSYATILKSRWVKKRLGIPERLIHDPADLPLANMTFSGQLQNAVDTGRVKRSTMDVRRLDDVAFRKAGVGPLRKTYKEPFKG